MSYEKVVIGNATLYRGDARDLLNEFPPVDALIGDPPYGQGYKVNTFHAGGTRRNAVVQRNGGVLMVNPNVRSQGRAAWPIDLTGVAMPRSTPRWKKTLALLRRGWTTALQSALAGGHHALSQRCGELRRAGYPVISKTVKTASGARIAAYRLEKEKA